MPRVIEIDDFDQLIGYQLTWHKLLAETRNASYFQSLDWLEAYWRHFGSGQTLRVLVVRSGDETLGILPLTVRSESTQVGALRTLTYLCDDSAAFCGPLGSQPAATLTAGLKHIQQSRRDWDLLDLRGVNRDGCDFGRTPNALSINQFQAHEQTWQLVPTIDLSDDWDDYWDARDATLKARVATSESRLAQHGTVTHVRYRPAGSAYDDADPRWESYDACERITEQSITEPGDPSSIPPGISKSRIETSEFLRDAHAGAVNAGALDLNFLLLDRQPVAFAYNLHYQGQVECFWRGCDGKLASCEPATLLMSRMLQDSCRRGDHTFRTRTNAATMVNPWLTSIETSYRYSHFPLTAIRAQALRLNRWMFARRKAPA